MNRTRTLITLLALFVTATVAFGQLSPQQKLMAKRAAELDAYRKMAERISGLKLSSETVVRDFLTESDEIRSSVEAFIRKIRIVQTRYYADGTVEVDAEVTIHEVVEKFKSLTDEVYRHGQWKKQQWDEIELFSKEKVLGVTGSGAARPDSTLPDPNDVSLFTETGGTAARPVNLPAIYSKYPPNERLKAKRAAEVDAQRKLVERIHGLRISSGTYVRDFVTESDEIRTAVNNKLKGMRIDNVRYAADGVVEVEMSVTIQQVVEIIKEVRDEVYSGGRWKTEVMENIKTRTQRKIITVLGTGALDTGGPVEEIFDGGDPEETIIVE